MDNTPTSDLKTPGPAEQTSSGLQPNLEAKHRAELAEAKAAQLRNEQNAALERAKQIEEYNARAANAQQDYDNLQRNTPPSK